MKKQKKAKKPRLVQQLDELAGPHQIQFIVSAEELEDCPTRRDGVEKEVEEQLRLFGTELICEAGILLKLPQVAMATGQTFFHRFYAKQSMKKYDVVATSASSLFIATKLEEEPRRLRDVCSVFHRIVRRRQNKSLEPLDVYETDVRSAYQQMRAQMKKLESTELASFGFILHIEQPHKLMISFLHYLEAGTELMQEACNLCNDSLRTTLCIQFEPHDIACGVIFLAARRLKIPLPEDPAWWDAFGAEKKAVYEVAAAVHALYSLPKAKYVPLQQPEESPANPLTPEVSPPVHESTPGKAPSQNGHASEGLANGQARGSQDRSGSDTTDRGDGASKERSHERDREARSHDQPEAVPRDRRARDDAAGLRDYERDIERYKERDTSRRDRDSWQKRDRDFTREKERVRSRSRDRDRGKNRDRHRDKGWYQDRERDRARDRDRDRGSMRSKVRREYDKERERKRVHDDYGYDRASKRSRDDCVPRRPDDRPLSRPSNPSQFRNPDVLARAGSDRTRLPSPPPRTRLPSPPPCDNRDKDRNARRDRPASRERQRPTPPDRSSSPSTSGSSDTTRSPKRHSDADTIEDRETKRAKGADGADTKGREQRDRLPLPSPHDSRGNADPGLRASPLDSLRRGPDRASPADSLRRGLEGDRAERAVRGTSEDSLLREGGRGSQESDHAARGGSPDSLHGDASTNGKIRNGAQRPINAEKAGEKRDVRVPGKEGSRLPVNGVNGTKVLKKPHEMIVWPGK